MRMKKFYLIALAACVALAACTKNEVKPVEMDQEITFKTISTKSTETEAYNKDNTFRSWAYLHDKPYAKDINNQLYLGGTGGLEISYITASSLWKNATSTYYWPKNGGKLTFFSYATNSDTCELNGATVKCDFEDGIIVEGFATDSNLNVDFLVADVAKDKTANVETYGHSGVPTLFRHKLSNVIFTINSKENYDKKTFKLQSIDLVNVIATASYIQNPLNPTAEGWNGMTLHNVTFCNTETEFSNTVVIPTALQSYYIPQTFADDTKVVLKYKIITDNGESDLSKHAVENVVVEKKLSELFGASWKMGTRYTCAITVSLDEILWDPAVEPWVDEYHTLPI